MLMSLSERFKSAMGYIKHLAALAGVLSILAMFAANFYLFHRVADLSDGYNSVAKSLHAAETQCAIANQNVLNIDRNYRNLKQLETHYINKSFTDK